MNIPKKGRKILVLDDVQYRWIAYSKGRGTEVRIACNQIEDGQVLVAQVPKLFNQQWVEDIIDFGYENSWEPLEALEPLVIRKQKKTYRVLDPEEISE